METQLKNYWLVYIHSAVRPVGGCLFVCLFFFSFFYFGHNKSIDIKTATCLRVSTCIHGRAATLHRNLDVLSVRYVCVRREERNNIIFVNFAAINVETLLQYRFIYFVVK